MFRFWLVIVVFDNVLGEKSNLFCKSTEKCEEDSSRWFVQVSESPVCYEPSLQSPIALNCASSISLMGNNLPVCYNFDSNVLLTLTYIGASVRFILREDSPVKPAISGGAFVIWPPYQFHDLHVHVRDSEHMVDGKRYPIEAHAVHWNTKYSSFEEAEKQTDGLVVLAIFGVEGGKDTPNLVGSLWSYLDSGESVTVTGEYLHHFLGNQVLSKQPYFFYKGSLTTPPYSENVQWMVFKRPFFHMSSRQLKTFTEMQSSDTSHSRELQCQNGRNVFYVLNTY